MNARARTVSNAAAGSLPPGFYHVAIDCPGYGRSPGDRQIVRSYPGGLISECIKSLSRRCAVALVGSSQGGAPPPIESVCPVLPCSFIAIHSHLTPFVIHSYHSCTLQTHAHDAAILEQKNDIVTGTAPIVKSNGLGWRGCFIGKVQLPSDMLKKTLFLVCFLLLCSLSFSEDFVPVPTQQAHRMGQKAPNVGNM
eukprot:4145736-Amphidinium_carterae.1